MNNDRGPRCSFGAADLSVAHESVTEMVVFFPSLTVLLSLTKGSDCEVH